MVFLAADRTRLAELDEVVRLYLAWESIDHDKDQLGLGGFQMRKVTKSLSENSVGVLFSRKRQDGEARRGRIPAVVSDREATKPVGPFRQNPPGGGSFARGRRWLGRHSPLRGCSGLAA